MNRDTSALKNFIDEQAINSTLKQAAAPDSANVQDILQKAREAKGLTLEETATLLQITDPELDQELFAAAKEVKNKIYGNRLVLFAPLYVTNECGNSCQYCGFNVSNKDLTRRTLTHEELRKDVIVLEEQGHKRILLVYGEHPKLKADWIAKTVETVYDTVSEKSGEIRRVNINCAPLSVDGFRKLQEVGIGTYQCFQETYHQDTYRTVHTGGIKRDFLWRLHAMHRAMEAGIEDVGMGVLFGLHDYKFEILALLTHAQELENKFGVGPHTLSFPRLEPALNAEMAYNPPCPIDNNTFKRIVAILRLAVPYTGLILSTRESAELRHELLDIGVSQVSAGSRTYPGAYSDPAYDRPDVQQFCISDSRSLDEVIHDIVKSGYLPSWCTACYRLGRTGEHFMDLAKRGFIQKYCLPNSLFTFREYLEDYATEATRQAGLSCIAKEVENCPEDRRELVASRLQRIEQGERDLYL